MVKIKYICKKCGHAEPETRWGIFVDLLLAFLVVNGIIFIAFFVFVGPTVMADGVLGSLGIFYARANSEQMRNAALNLTTYSGDNPFKWALDLAQNIGDMRYVPSNPYKMIQAPEDTSLYGGDCKNTAIMYTSMLTTLNVPAKVDCSVEYHHCVTRVDDGEYYMVVDFANGFWAVYNQTNDFWDYPSASLAFGQMAYKEPLSVVEPGYFKRLILCCNEVTGECYQREYCDLYP
jgi:hypothetical protein